MNDVFFRGFCENIFEEYILDFEDDGLKLEGGRSHRAYSFVEQGGR